MYEPKDIDEPIEYIDGKCESLILLEDINYLKRRKSLEERKRQMYLVLKEKIRQREKDCGIKRR